MADKPKSASDYLAEARASAKPRQRRAAPVAPMAAPVLPSAPMTKPDKPQSPLNWVMDILSRPLYAMTNTQSKLMDADDAAKEKFAKGDFMGGVGEKAKGYARTASGAAALEGFFSTDESAKAYSSDLIKRQIKPLIEKEQTSTEYLSQFASPEARAAHERGVMKSLDVAAGVGGFIGDVGLDPLTYVPGAAFVKAGQMIGKGATGLKGAAKGASAARASAKLEKAEKADAATAAKSDAAADEAADKAAKAVVTPAPVTPQSATEALGRRMDEAGETPPVADPAAKVSEVVEGLAKYTPEEIDKLMSTPRASTIKATLEKFKSQKATGPRITEADLSPAQAAAVAKVEAKLSEPMKFSKTWVEQAENLALDLPIEKQPKVRLASGVEIPLTTATGRVIAKGVPRAERLEAEAALRQWYEDSYIPAHVAAQKTGMQVDEIGNPVAARATPEEISAAGVVTQVQQDAIDARLRVERFVKDAKYRDEEYADYLSSGGTGTLDEFSAEIAADATATAEKVAIASGEISAPSVQIVNAMDTFKREALLNREMLVATLGRKLVRSLEQNAQRPDTFDSVMSTLRSILNQTFDYEAVSKLTPPSVRLLESLGMDPIRVPLGMNKPKSIPNVEQVPKHIQDVLARANVDMPVKATDEQLSIAEKAINNYARDIVKAKQDFLNETRTGANLELPVDNYGKNQGNILAETNNYKQVNLSTIAIKEVSATLKGLTKGDELIKQVAGRARAHYMRDNVIAVLRVAERALDIKGIPLVLAVGGKQRIPLAQSQIMDVLNQFDNPVKPIMDAAYWNANSAVAPTNFLDAIHAAVIGGSRTDIEDAIRQEVTKHNGVEYVNNIINPKRSKRGGVLGQERIEGHQIIRELVDLIERSVPTLTRVAEDNAKAYQARSLAEAMQMTDETLQELEVAFEAGRISDLLHGIDDISTRIGKEAEAMGATAMAESLARVQAENLVPAADRIKAEYAVKGERIEQAADKANAGKTAVAQAEAVQRAGVENQLEGSFKLIDEARMVDAEAPTPTSGFDNGRGSSIDETRDTGTPILRSLHTTFVSKMTGVVNRSRDLGGLHRAVVEAEGMWRNMVGRVANDLNDINRGLGGDKALWQEAFVAVQRGIPVENPAIAPHMKDIERLVTEMFGKADENSLLGSRFFSTNASVDHINKVFASFKMKDDIFFDVEKAKLSAAANGTTLRVEAAQQWRTWTIDDPAEFINKAYTSLAKINTDMSVATAFAKLASETPEATSRFAKAGYQRITNDSGNSILAMYLPTDYWVQTDVLNMLHAADNLMQQTLDLGAGGLNRFVKEFYKPVQDMWKFGMTIPNPTHHIRNGISDASLTYLAEGIPRTNIYRDAMYVLATHNGYTNFDAIRALNGAGYSMKPGRTIVKTRHGDLTDSSLYLELQNRGNLPNFRTLEQLDDDIIDSTTGKIMRAWNKTQHTKGVRALGGVAEGRDHYFRIAHAIQIVEKNKDNPAFKNMDELLTFASDRVRKWHPDGSDLTNTEQIFKLIIPFYSWQRKTIPLIVEALLTQPARVTIIPKASYNLAVAMGIDPNSLSDPFPEDQMFPSYMTEKMTGPVYQNQNGDYYGVNPGFAANDVLNEYAGDNPIRSILGSVSPLIRAPFELATGAQVGTGGRINDTSDYIDGQLPGVGVASRVTGNSVTGSIVSGIQGKGLDEQYQIAAGNKDKQESTTTALLAWLGLSGGLQNMSAPNAQNYAEIEKRDREAAKGAERSGY